MASNISFNGVTYSIPADGDSGWGADLTAYLIAISTGVLARAGGVFTLTADVDFGSNFGLKSPYYISKATNPSATGALRLGNTQSVGWRNFANSADVLLTVTASDVLQFNGSSFIYSGLGSIVNADINAAAAIAYSKLNLTGLIVNADIGAAAAIAYSKLNLTGTLLNADVNAAAAIAYSKLNLATSILNADINASAAIALTKLAATTVSRALVSDVSGFVSPATTTAVEIGYVNGVTSAIQTQMNLKAPLASPTFTGTVTVPATITSGAAVLTLPTASDTLVGKATTDTLTNKSISGSTSTITNVSLTTGVTGTLPLLNGGTGQTTKAAAFDALSPMTTLGDITYGGAAGTGTRLATGTAGQYLKTNGAAAPTWATFTAPTFTRLSSGTSLTYTTPANVKYLIVTCVGSGGSGGSSGTGSFGAGNAGSSTTFGITGTIVQATGGTAGAQSSGTAGGSGTTAATSIYSQVGGTGQGSTYNGSSNMQAAGGDGGTNMFGGVGGGGSYGSAGLSGVANTGAGGGGGGGPSGATTTFYTGGGGAAGGVIRALISSPAASYTYTVAAGGAAATAGTSGFASGAGGSGVIIVEEYYQ